MKKFVFVAAIAMSLTSVAAFAEQGSGQLNQITQPTSTVHHDSGDLTMAPADLPLINGDAEKNMVVAPSSHDQQSSSDNQVALSDLPHRNAS